MGLVAEAFADQLLYTPGAGTAVARRERIRIIPPFQFPNVQVILIGQISDELLVGQPLQISIEKEADGSFVVSDDIFLVYGDGDTQSDALNDYVESLITYYEIVKENAEKNNFDRILLNQLHSYIQQRGDNAIQTNRS